MTVDGGSRERSDGIVAPLFHSVRLPYRAMPRCHGVLLAHFLSVNNYDVSQSVN